MCAGQTPIASTAKLLHRERELGSVGGKPTSSCVVVVILGGMQPYPSTLLHIGKDAVVPCYMDECMESLRQTQHGKR